jgi:hypothetical protein
MADQDLSAQMEESLASLPASTGWQQKEWFRRSEVALLFGLAQARTHQIVTPLLAAGKVTVRPPPYGAGWHVHRDSLLTVYAPMVAAHAVVVRRPERGACATLRPPEPETSQEQALRQSGSTAAQENAGDG